ncbi:MAG: DUF2142 domain-containing protein [Actinobacteria bacterium]|nr:DUF2142 domain-containing protein [Actinomycetota bacterium]
MTSPPVLGGRDQARRLAPWLFVLAYLTLVVAWVGANPPGAAPDEPAHYVKALAAGGGALVGTPPPAGSEEGLSAVTPGQKAWQARTTRLVPVPPSLAAPPWLACNAHLTEVSSACREPGEPAPERAVQPTYVGTYQPFLYLAPGWLARLAGDASDAILLARGAGAIVAVTLFALAVLALWDPDAGAASLVGLLLALTPMVVFLASAVSASGAEVAAGLCYLAAVLRLARPGPPSSSTWVALAVGGSVLSLSRSLGPMWVVLGAAVLPAASGVGRTRAVLRGGGWRAVAAGSAVALSMASSIAWELTRQVHPEAGRGVILGGVVPALGELPEVYRQHVGVFGWLDTQLPTEAYLVWSLGLGAIGVSAMVLGSARQRLVLAVLALASVMLSVVVSAALIRPTGFGMQARYVMPLTVVVPLFAGEVVRSQWARVRSWVLRAALWPAVAAVAGVQFLAWYTNARRQAVGTDGPKLFLGAAEWQPPLGWLAWMVLALLGSALLVLAAVAAGPGRPGRSLLAGPQA